MPRSSCDPPPEPSPDRYDWEKWWPRLRPTLRRLEWEERQSKLVSEPPPSSESTSAEPAFTTSKPGLVTLQKSAVSVPTVDEPVATGSAEVTESAPMGWYHQSGDPAGTKSMNPKRFGAIRYPNGRIDWSFPFFYITVLAVLVVFAWAMISNGTTDDDGFHGDCFGTGADGKTVERPSSDCSGWDLIPERPVPNR